MKHAERARIAIAECRKAAADGDYEVAHTKEDTAIAEALRAMLNYEDAIGVAREALKLKSLNFPRHSA